jgi:membrane fusion protein (multidrug efflux system)
VTTTNVPVAEASATPHDVEPKMREVFYTALVVFALNTSALAQQQPSTAVPVGIVKAERKPIAKAGDFVGRVDAISRVEIRARITGFLEEVLFKEGDLIKEGTPLYHIEMGLFEAQVQQAEGALERSKAAKALSRATIEPCRRIGREAGRDPRRPRSGARAGSTGRRCGHGRRG